LDYGTLNIATTRPETIFADVAVAVHPQDKRYAKLIGQTAASPLLGKIIPIIADDVIDIKFGTGALKVTPAHDTTDWEIGQRHHLPTVKGLAENGRLINCPKKYLGLKVLAARKAVVKDLESSGKLFKTEPLTHSVGVCYRCKTTLEPTLTPQWYVKTKPLAQAALAAVKTGQTKIVPQKRFEKMYLDWMKNILDWNISRQIVWGPRIPAWYCLKCTSQIRLVFLDKNQQKIVGPYQEIRQKYGFAEIAAGLQSLNAPVEATYQLANRVCQKCGSQDLLQETDTFDTWFLSGQWPMTTLRSKPGDIEYFYPTSVLDTLWDILLFWVARMMMLGLYCTGQVPFKTVHIHARVVDKEGKKMSKSRGNVLNPLEMVQKYGADALRLSLVYGVSPASDVAVYEDKIRAMRNFINKIWNAARFVLTNHEGKVQSAKGKTEEDQRILKELHQTVKKVTAYLNKYRFDLGLETIYDFFWHAFCDRYLESTKNRRREAQPVLEEVLKTSLKLLHPFAPFVTEAIWQQFPEKQPVIISTWPK
jgi:valyl-tRNA synthetase